MSIAKHILQIIKSHQNSPEITKNPKHTKNHQTHQHVAAIVQAAAAAKTNTYSLFFLEWCIELSISSLAMHQFLHWHCITNSSRALIKPSRM
jgi:hypothetical protein